MNHLFLYSYTFNYQTGSDNSINKIHFIQYTQHIQLNRELLRISKILVIGFVHIINSELVN